MNIYKSQYGLLMSIPQPLFLNSKTHSVNVNIEDFDLVFLQIQMKTSIAAMF